MQLRVAAVCAALAACGQGSITGGDGGTGDGGGNGADRPPGAPPALSAASPSSDTSIWLHDPVRLRFDRPLDPGRAATAQPVATIDGVPVAASAVLETPDTLAITVDPAARGLGTLALHLPLADITGDPATPAYDARFALPAWSGAPVDRGAASSPPSLAVDAAGGVVAAWTVGAPGSRRVVVARLAAGAWTPLGALLGARDASAAAIALDAGARPIAAWIEDGAAHVARWDGSAWQDFASPGAGDHLALAAPAGGDPVIAVFGGAVAVRRLTGDAWQPVGDDLAIPSALAGDPALAVGDVVAVGWIDAGGQLRVSYTGDRWIAVAPIALGAPPAGVDHLHLSLAVRGAQIAVAWDQWAGSLGVLAARTTAGVTAWTRLGHALDIDPDDDAVAPAIAIDTSGAPIVAWTEQSAGAQRGVVARLASGTGAAARWTVVGGTTFLPDPGAVPSRVAIALHRGDAPVVGWTSAGAASIARFNGPALAPSGLSARASIAGCAIAAAAPPPLLSQTGCFTLAAPGKPVPHPGLVPYGVVSALWSDTTHKRRWIGLPDGAPAMTESRTGAWTPAPGTLLVKEFALDTTPGDPSTRRAVETRLLVRDPQLGWQGFSYRWRADGSDAALQPDEAQTFAWPLDDGTQVPHVYPSRSHCVSCHEGSYGPLLGLRAIQLQRWFDYDGVIADQLPTLAQLGIGPASAAPAMVSPHDPSETVEHRVRGYLAANCAHCHNPDHIAIKDLRYTTPLAATRLCDVIVPGDPAHSVVFQKVSSRPGMPPLGTALVDPLAVSLIRDWISAMTSCP